MISELKGKNVNARLWVPAHEVESGALDQVRNVCSLEGVIGVAIMPDCHFGMGATIGSVIVTKDTISPALTGVDIGCGMMAVRTSLKGRDLREKTLMKIHDGIRERIPVGFNRHDSVHKAVKALDLWDTSFSLHKDVHEFEGTAMAQLGTLGGGNHFIELSVDADDNVWIMLHSGSRRIGKEIADAHVREAKRVCQGKKLPDKALAYFNIDTPEFNSYMNDLMWAQQYALLNRDRMMVLIQDWIGHLYPSVVYDKEVRCHHNYVEADIDWNNNRCFITRKGAISAKKDEWGIIPGAMGARSYIVQGLGNTEAYQSAPHGAGRRMSRSKAKKKYRLQDLKETMKGIVCKVDKHTVDEIQYSYKDIGKVMEYSTELVKPVFELSQIMNIKG